MAEANCMCAPELVQDSLSNFVKSYIPGATLESIDDIVLSYILGVLEELGNDDGFEVDGFVEMMQAYIPGFEGVSSDITCDWIFKLADDLSKAKEKENSAPNPSSEVVSTSPPPFDGNEKGTSLSQVSGGQALLELIGGQRSLKSAKQEIRTEDDDAQVRQLLEMFPASCSLEARRCLATANGQLEDAVQLMLMEMEKADAPPSVSKDEWRMKKAQHDDKKVKDSILQKYGYVDVHDDSVTHNPVAPKQEKKKMVRYLNNQVCSTKGERFIEIKKPMTEEMKKTYINLKPARSYHFH